jgi:hypothetical protein
MKKFFNFLSVFAFMIAFACQPEKTETANTETDITKDETTSTGQAMSDLNQFNEFTLTPGQLAVSDLITTQTQAETSYFTVTFIAPDGVAKATAFSSNDKVWFNTQDDFNSVHKALNEIASASKLTSTFMLTTMGNEIASIAVDSGTGSKVPVLQKIPNEVAMR